MKRFFKRWINYGKSLVNPDAMRGQAAELVISLAGCLKKGNREGTDELCEEIALLGESAVEPLVWQLLSKSGVSRFYHEDEEKCRGHQLSFSFSDEEVSRLDCFAGLLARIGLPARPFLLDLVRGRKIGSRKFSPRNHEGMMIAMEKMAGLLKDDLLQILRSTHLDAEARETAAYILRFIPEAPVIESLLDVALENSPPNLPYVIMHSLSFMGKNSTDLFFNFMKSPDVKVRKEVCTALVRSHTKRGIAFVIAQYAKEHDEEIRTQILEDLAKATDPQAVDFFKKMVSLEKASCGKLP